MASSVDSAPINVMKQHINDILYEIKNIERGRAKPNSIFYNLTEELNLKQIEDSELSLLIVFLEAIVKRCDNFINDDKRKAAIEAVESPEGVLIHKESREHLENYRNKVWGGDHAAKSFKKGTFGPKDDDNIKESLSNAQGCITCLEHGKCPLETKFAVLQSQGIQQRFWCEQWKPGAGHEKHMKAIKEIKEASTFVGRNDSLKRAEEKRKERSKGADTAQRPNCCLHLGKEDDETKGEKDA